MYKKLHCSVRLVFALSCIFCMLFSSTLSVRAVNNFFSLVDSTLLVDESAITLSYNLAIEPTETYTDIGGGTYSGSSSGTTSSTGTATPQDSYWSVNLSGTQTQSGSLSFNGTEYNGRISANGSWTQSSGSWQSSVGSTISPENFNLSDSGTLSASNSGTITLNSTHGGSTIMHYHIPVKLLIPTLQNTDIDPNKYYMWYPHCQNFSVSYSGLSNVTIYNFALLSTDGKILSTPDSTTRGYVPYLGSEVISSQTGYIVIQNYLDFDLCCPSINDYYVGTISFNLLPRFRKFIESAQGSVGNIQSDPIQHQLQEENNTITQDTNTTTHSIFDSISAFFGSFFDNLIGVFVPEDGYFTTWFNNLNTLLTNKLGILYYPFSVFIDICNRLVTAVAGNQPTDAVIYFPELKIKVQNVDYVFVQAQEVHLADYSVNIQNADTSNSPMFGLNNLIHVIRRFTDIILTLSIFSLLRTKVNLILRGENNDN